VPAPPTICHHERATKEDTMSATARLIDSATLHAAQAIYDQTMNDDNRAVRDATITPFAMAMKLDGFKTVMKNGCAVRRGCPHCKGWYSTQYTFDSATYWACPHCQRIDQE